MKANGLFILLDGIPPAVEMGADNRITTTTCKRMVKNIESDGTPPTIEMGTETEGTNGEDLGTKGKDEADNLDGTPHANKMETDNMNIIITSATTAKKGPCKADNPKNAIVADSMISQSSAATYMDALLEAMSPECKALIIMPRVSYCQSLQTAQPCV